MAPNPFETNTLSLEDVLEDVRINPPTEDPETLPSEHIGTRCDTKTLYEGPKKCDCCINWVEEYPSNTTRESTEQESDVRRYAIVCRVKLAHEDSKEPLELHSIIIQSPLLKSILGDIFIGYPGITTTLKEVKFRRPFWEFFYGWKSLTEAQARYEPDSEEHKHIHKLLDTLTSQLGSIHNVARDLIQNGVITYDFLWVLFAPGTQVYSHLFDQDCILEVKRTYYYKGQLLTRNTYDVRCKYVEWDGENFGWKTKLIEIPEFCGTKSIQELEVYPIMHHRSADDIRSNLLARGRKFLSLGGWHHKAYAGAIEVSGESLFGSNKLRINERVVVDAQAFAQHTKQDSDRNEPALDLLPNDLSDHHIMLCSPVVKAYGLRTKCWGNVHVDGISDIKWDENAFHNLVLEHETKRLIESFVLAQTRQKRSLEFDDIVEGKGQGMIMLLTGEPGVGKTLTAETVAEKACRPLYMVSAGELGSSGDTVERGLTKVFDLANRWNAVLLLDESDVFLEERTSENLERNQLVSVFLRMLEYYRGMMFLTTNRLSVFDPAFQSRIHLTLHYNSLDQESRRKIWQVLLKHAQIDENLSEENLVALSKEAINGRQIKNAVKAAKLLAATEDVALNVAHVNTALRVMRNGRNPKVANNSLASLMRRLAKGFGATQ